MSRPEFPTGIVLPTNCISRIREEQEYYDQDPERYERERLEREEEKTMEQYREVEYQQQCIEEAENYAELNERNPKYDKGLDEDLPF